MAGFRRGHFPQLMTGLTRLLLHRAQPCRDFDARFRVCLTAGREPPFSFGPGCWEFILPPNNTEMGDPQCKVGEGLSRLNV